MKQITKTLTGMALVCGFVCNVAQAASIQSMTIEEIGDKYDLTKERIRQIKERAIKRLQKARYSNALKVYLG